MKLFGRFQLIVENTKTGKITDTGWIDNLVLDNAFNFMLIPLGSKPHKLLLGTGSTPAAVTDLSLETPLVDLSIPVASSIKAGATTDYTAPNYTTSAGWEESFALGAVVGNVSEIGIEIAGSLVTRALITDGLGDPTTITLGANDILTVNYLMGFIIDTSFPAGSISVDFDGTPINLTAKWVDLGKGLLNLNGMNGQIFPYTNLSAQQYFWICDVLPSDPLSDINGGVTPAGYLTSTSGVSVGGLWSANITATGSSWTKSMTYTSNVGVETGNWNGVIVGSGASRPMVLFEFDATFAKAANQQVTITVEFELSRA